MPQSWKQIDGAFIPVNVDICTHTFAKAPGRGNNDWILRQQDC